MALVLECPAFRDGDMIQQEYTCDGANISPPLLWRTQPPEARSLALIVDDPDAPAGTWVHWIMYNILPACAGLPTGIPKDSQLPDGAMQGITSYRMPGYGGPCPPSGTHRYFFRLYALDRMLSLGPGATRNQVDEAMQGHIIAEACLMGRYRRR